MNEKSIRKEDKGQVISEYAIVLAMFTMIAVMLIFLLAVFTEYGWRIIVLVNDYPYSW